MAIASDTTFDFPTYGVSVSVPETLQRIPEGSPGHLGRWAKLGGDGVAEFILAVEASPKGKHDLQSYAQETVKAVGGSISSDAAELGGDKALKALGSSTGTEMRPLEALIVEREGMFYLLSRIAKNADDGLAEFGEMKQSWKWIPVESASDHLALTPEPVPLFENLFSFRPPTLVRPYEVANPKVQASLGIYNCLTKGQDFFLNIDVLRRKGSLSLDQMGEEFAQNAKKGLQSKDPVTWERRKDGVEYLLSKPISVETPNPDGTPVKQVIQFLMFAAKSKWVLFTCVITAKDESAQKAYMALIDEVGRTIAIPEPPAEETNR